MITIEQYIGQVIAYEKKRKPINLVGTFSCVGLALLLFYIPIEGTSDIRNFEFVKTIDFVLLGIISLLILGGILFVIKIFIPVEKFPPYIIKLLQTDSNKIIWIYPEIRNYNGQPVGTTLKFATIDGKKTEGPLLNNDINYSMNEMTQLFPNALLGFDIEYEKTFRKDPVSLSNYGRQ